MRKRTTYSNQKKNMAFCNILGKLVIEQLRFGRFFIALNKDFSNPDFATTLLKCLLHALTSSDNAKSQCDE
jgi:hypothetical protein